MTRISLAKMEHVASQWFCLRFQVQQELRGVSASLSKQSFLMSRSKQSFRTKCPPPPLMLIMKARQCKFLRSTAVALKKNMTDAQFSDRLVGKLKIAPKRLPTFKTLWGESSRILCATEDIFHQLYKLALSALYMFV